MKESQKLLLLTIFGLAVQSTASADGFRLAVGALAGATGVDVSSNNASESVDLVEKSKFGYGVGGLIEVPIVDFFGLETGALYLHRRFDIENANVKVTRTVPSLVIPIEARFWIFDFITAAAGGFASIQVGDTKDEIKYGNYSFTNEISNDDRKFAEFGLTAAVGVNFPVWDKTGLFAEARYNHGLSDSSDNGSFEERIRDVIFMAGARFDFGESDHHAHYESAPAAQP